MNLGKRSVAIMTCAILFGGASFIDAAGFSRTLDVLTGFRAYINGSIIPDRDSNGNPSVMVYNGSTYIAVENIGTENWSGNVVNIRTENPRDTRNSQRVRRLGEIRLTSSQSYSRVRDFRDPSGYPYDDAYRFDASLDSFAIYDLRGNLNRFEAKFVAGRDTGDSARLNMQIFLDDRLAFQFTGLTKNSGSIPISLDLSGVRTMKIITSNSGKSSNGFCYLIDARVL